MKPTLIFGREPAVLLALIAAIIQSVGAFAFHLTKDQQATLNAVAAGVLGLIVACMVHKADSIVAAGTALAQAGIACALGFGLQLTPDMQTAIMALVVQALGAAFVRQAVEAKVTREQLRASLRLAA